MGGMIAIKMAEILESEGEEVVGVVLIDSSNPEGYPAFSDARERDEVAEWTYRAYAGRSGLPGLEELGDSDDGVLCKESDRDSGLGDQDDDDDDEVDVMDYLPRMRKHIYNSLDLLAGAGQGAYVPKKLDCPVTLVKCTQLASLPEAMSEERKKAVRYRFEDERAGWPMEKFRSIRVEAQHDDVFDAKHVGEVTDVLRGVLEGMR